jgi:hypothetical protein
MVMWDSIAAGACLALNQKLAVHCWDAGRDPVLATLALGTWHPVRDTSPCLRGPMRPVRPRPSPGVRTRSRLRRPRPWAGAGVRASCGLFA